MNKLNEGTATKKKNKPTQTQQTKNHHQKKTPKNHQNQKTPGTVRRFSQKQIFKGKHHTYRSQKPPPIAPTAFSK